MTTTTTTTTTAIASDYKARASISSTTSTDSTTTLYSLTNSQNTFNATRILHVDSRGIGAFRLPIPSRQREIIISNSDGSEAYTSTRDKLWSGNSLLSHAKQGNLIRTDYFFGPSREPILHYAVDGHPLQAEMQIHVSGQWTSRTTRFVMPGGQEYEWFYAKEKSDGQRTNLLVLRAVRDSKIEGKEGNEGNRRIAQLVRGAETRTAGTSRCTAGNGGELQLDEKMMEGELELDTSVVVATCLMMLKKEIDRRRLIQMCVIGGAGSGS